MILDIENLSVSLGGRRILDGVSFSAGPGEFIGLVGPNGAGKSTLLRAAAGLLPADAGARRLDGEPLAKTPLKKRARRLAYLPQSRPIYWAMTARDVAALGRFAFGNPLTRDLRDRKAVENALSLSGAGHLAENPASELSGGELSRVHLARALAAETPLLLADEPVSALDPAHQISVMKLLRAMADEGKTVIAALHDLPLAARYCTRILALHGGVLKADGPPEDVLTDETMRRIFQVGARMNGEGDLVIHPLTD